MEQGLIHFYLGNGKGKSTALFGLALRALGRNFKVLIIQVLKTRETGEILYFNSLNEKNLKIIRIKSSSKFSWEMSANEKLESIEKIKMTLLETKKEINNYDLVLFDEFLNAQSLDFLSEEEIIEIIKNKQKNQEYVFTGRKTTENLKMYADYISVINAEKHPYEKGISARIGIEF